MSRTRYQNPPVHEVVLDLQFAEDVGQETIAAAESRLLKTFGPAQPLNTVSFNAGLSASGPTPLQTSMDFNGWEFRNEDPTRVVRVQRRQLTMHFIRSATWPQGEYIGWEAILKAYTHVHNDLGFIYGRVDIRRAGLRYINRIAVTEGTKLETLFNLLPPNLPRVQSLYTFSTHQSWAEVEAHEHLSASVRFGRVDLPTEADTPENAIGVLLDLDVFNLFESNAPDWDNLLAWFSEAHKVENDMFEDSITDELRSTFHTGASE